MKCLPYIKPFLYASHCPKAPPIYCVSSNNNTWGRHYHHQFTKKLGSKRFWKSAQGLAATTQRPTPSERVEIGHDWATNTHALVSLAESLRLSLMPRQQHFNFLPFWLYSVLHAGLCEWLTYVSSSSSDLGSACPASTSMSEAISTFPLSSFSDPTVK